MGKITNDTKKKKEKRKKKPENDMKRQLYTKTRDKHCMVRAIKGASVSTPCLPKASAMVLADLPTCLNST